MKKTLDFITKKEVSFWWGIASAGTVITVYKDMAAGSWTNTNNKRAIMQGFYEI